MRFADSFKKQKYKEAKKAECPRIQINSLENLKLTTKQLLTIKIENYEHRRKNYKKRRNQHLKK